jgi:hypothetical protein
MNRLQKIIGDRHFMSDALDVSRDLAASDLAQIVREGDVDHRDGLGALLDEAERQVEWNYRWSRRTVPGVPFLIGDIQVPFTGHAKRQAAKQDLENLEQLRLDLQQATSDRADRLQLYQVHAELVRQGMYEAAQQILHGLIDRD